MALGQWSTTAANNATAATNINWQEGQAPSTVNNSARQLMADVATWFQGGAEWLNMSDVPTYVGATQFSVPTNRTSVYTVGRRVRASVTAGTVYGTITASAFGSVTTVTLSMDSGALDAGLSEVDVGILNPAYSSFPPQANLDAGGNGGQFRAVLGNYGAMLRNDGTSCYLLSTGSGAQYGTFNAYRPFAWNLATGAVTIDGTGIGTTFGGSITADYLAINGGSGQIQAAFTGTGGYAYQKIACSGGAKYFGVIGNNFSVVNQANSAVLLSIDDAGNTTVTGNLTVNSDERLKCEWEQLPVDFIESLAAVRSGTYTRRDSGERHVGIGAQSLQPLLPEAVVESEKGVLSVAYGQAALVACVELAKEVVRLRALLEPAK